MKVIKAMLVVIVSSSWSLWSRSSCPLQRRHAGFSAASPSAHRASLLANVIEMQSKSRRRRESNNKLVSNLFYTNVVDTFGSSSLINDFFQRRGSTPWRRRTASKRVRPSTSSLSRAILDWSPVCDLERSEMKCDAGSRYRSYSGRCNNLRHAHYGKHTIPLRRLLRSHYEDGLSKARSMSKDKINPLPNPRLVSTKLHHNGSAVDNRHTSMLMQFGQLLDHDISSTPMIRDVTNEIIDCSECNADPNRCNPIPVPLDDPFFPSRHRLNHTLNCIPFTRSMPGQLEVGTREQLNQITAFLDASHIYGSDPCRVEELRSDNKGELRTWTHPMSHVFKPLMPIKEGVPECEAQSGQCFFTGDDRNNEQPGLTSLHTLFVREHNRLASKLSALNPHWQSDRVFEESRRIVVALEQNIVYSEFLPRVLGSRLMSHFDLVLEKEGEYYDNYVSECQADVSNAFATAAFRFGHSLIQPGLHLSMDSPVEMRLREHFNNPDIVKNTPLFVDAVIKALSNTNMQKADRTVTNELTNHLFEHRANPLSGMDLAALNIQRGRDHGLPGYVFYQRLCSSMLNISSVQDFDDLKPIMDGDNVQLIRAVYRHIEDVDLFSGGLSERPVSQDALVGPTFGCILAEQFRRLRQCDRFWFESNQNNLKFTKSQLREIRKTNLASVLCHNCDMAMKLQRSVFDVVDASTNPAVDCHTEHRSLDVAPWHEQVDEVSGESGGLLHAFCEFNGRIVLPSMSVRVSACVMCKCEREGGVCDTLHFDNCDQLVDDVGIQAVQVDHHCRAECRRRIDNNQNSLH